MVRYLLNRPVAVLVCFVLTMGLGIYLLRHIPISLLPQADVPVITIKADHPNTPARQMEATILKPLRENLTTLQGLADLQSIAANHSGTITLTFEYGTRMDMALLLANEKIDRTLQYLPRGLERPLAMRANTTDIPIVRLQVIPASPDDMMQTTDLVQQVLKRRLEQLPGVSMVDVNGGIGRQIAIAPNPEVLNAAGISPDQLATAIRNANGFTGTLSLKEGQYRYFVNLDAALKEPADIGSLPIALPGGSWTRLAKLATIDLLPIPPQGYHLYNGQEGLVITIQKTADSRLTNLLAEINEITKQFKKDYPALHFSLTQNQEYLLEAGISNLQQDLLYGGAATILLLFLFLGNWRSPLIMSISIPISLLFTFILFKLFGISFNIISLSGLTLGIGNLIDNTVIVVDNIIRKRRNGESVINAAVAGTNEVIIPITSQVLTTVAVYAPLVILSGLAGILVAEQGIALTISLGVSLTVAFILAPLLYTFLFKNQQAALQEDTRFYQWVNRGYHRMIDGVLRHPKIYFALTLLLMPVGFFLAPLLPVESLPPIAQTETQLSIDWNKPIDAAENRNRTIQLMQAVQAKVLDIEAETGIPRFVMQQANQANTQQAIVYYKTKDEKSRILTDSLLQKWLQSRYPEALFTQLPAPNAFTQLFSGKTPYLEARCYAPPQGNLINTADAFAQLLTKLPALNYTTGLDMLSSPNYELLLNRQAMQQYGISENILGDALEKAIGRQQITDIKRYGDVLPVTWKQAQAGLEKILLTEVQNPNGAAYTLRQFVTVAKGTQPKYILADKAGTYHSLQWQQGDAEKINRSLKKPMAEAGWQYALQGRYYQDKEQLSRLWLIFALVVFLLYIILVVQYESLTQPLLVMLTIPLGISGAMVLLWLTGSSLNVMAAIGFIVVLGLIVDDPILKMETLNRLEKKYLTAGIPLDDKLLKRMIHEAGDTCLKPLLMVSLTTSIAMVPVLIIPGIGNDLQKPLALVIIGGLTIGTFFTTWFIPLAYWYSRKLNRLIKNKKHDA